MTRASKPRFWVVVLITLSVRMVACSAAHVRGQAPPAGTSDVARQPDAVSAFEALPEGPQLRRPHRHALFLHPLSVLRRGVVLGYEYAVPQVRTGLVVEFSFERRARGDFHSTSAGIGVGARVYLMGKRFAHIEGPACIGLFFGAMGTMRITGLREGGTRDVVGHGARATFEAQVGFRVPIRNHAEISVLGIAGLHTDFIGGLALQVRPSLAASMTVGWLFGQVPRESNRAAGQSR